MKSLVKAIKYFIKSSKLYGGPYHFAGCNFKNHPIAPYEQIEKSSLQSTLVYFEVYFDQRGRVATVKKHYRSIIYLTVEYQYEPDGFTEIMTEHDGNCVKKLFDWKGRRLKTYQRGKAG